MSGAPWWKEAVIYQVYPRSFFDTNGDGEGDLKGIINHLDYLRYLGVDALWLSPFYSSPNKDGGYDVSNPREVDPRFGNLKDAQELFNGAHELELKVIVDIIPNHFSSEHEWFKLALNSSKGSPERARFHFYEGKDAQTPPNNWISLFGGAAWTQIDDGQWYLHLFDSSQPDLNWENQEVKDDFEKTLRFWLDLGVDGFRIDVAHGLVKEALFHDHYDPQGLSNALRLDIEMDHEARSALLATVPFFDRDGVHEIYRQWRRIFDSYHRDVMAVAEAWVHPPERATRYVRADELQQVFNFDMLVTPFGDREIFERVDGALTLMNTVGALPTWALSNHDTPRLVSRIGKEAALALALFTFGLPGSCYVYQGQELGLPDADLEDRDRQDPAFFRTHGAQKGRDGARVPLPWSGSTTPFGFSSGRPWLPIPQEWAGETVEMQRGDGGSSLEKYRQAMDLRSRYLSGMDDFSWTITPNGSGVISYRRGAIQVALNTSDLPVELNVSGQILIASDGLTDVINGEVLIGPRACIWLLF